MNAIARTDLVAVSDDDFVAMLRGDACVRAGLAAPPGGVDQPAVVAHVRAIAGRLDRHGCAGHWMAVSGGEVVGLIGYKDPLADDGEVEIGYGMAASRRGLGYATRAVSALLELARADPAIRAVRAETLLANRASQRVLEKNGFVRTGTRSDGVDGMLVLWRCDVAATPVAIADR